MIFTASQHRQIARLIKLKARKAPLQFKPSLLRLARQHMGMASAQERDPRLRPAMAAVAAPSIAPG
jgi:hypothetical protein